MDADPDNTEGLSDSPANESMALMEADEGEGETEERTKSMDSMDGDKESETSKLLNNAEPHPSRPEQGNSEPKSPREFSYAYHFKKKYTFRSDSVYSDVTPMSSATQSTSSKDSETRDKCGSLSSLKPPQSKWMSLKKKLGKINSSSSGKSKSASSPSDERNETSLQSGSTPQTAAAALTSTTSGRPIKSIAERRSLLQRAKTLSILPVNSAPKREAPPKKMVQPPELFNVGGEMNLIPLEMLIDINDIRMPKK